MLPSSFSVNNNLLNPHTMSHILQTTELLPQTYSTEIASSIGPKGHKRLRIITKLVEVNGKNIAKSYFLAEHKSPDTKEFLNFGFFETLDSAIKLYNSYNL
jgi:hypothetical protein